MGMGILSYFVDGRGWVRMDGWIGGGESSNSKSRGWLLVHVRNRYYVRFVGHFGNVGLEGG